MKLAAACVGSVLLVAACTSAGGSLPPGARGPSDASRSVALGPAARDSRPLGDRGRQSPRSRLHRLERVTQQTCTPAHNTAAISQGVGAFCVPFNSIPAIRHPTFQAARDAGYLNRADLVISVSIHGDARAYPVRILLYHEVVNDVVGGRPVVVSYCPLCNSGVAYSRTAGGRTLSFGVSGELFHANLVMFDFETLSLWSQISGRTLSGSETGRRLKPILALTVPFGAWKRAHPAGKVLAPPRSNASYRTDPYAGYGSDASQDSIFFRPSPDSSLRSYTDPRLPPKTRVIGVAGRSGSVAFSFPSHGQGRVVEHARLDGRALVALFHFGVHQPETSRLVDAGPQSWSATVWAARARGRLAEVRASDDGFVDDRTGGRINMFGRIVSGPLAGASLQPVAQETAFWFAWAAFHPHTAIAGR